MSVSPLHPKDVCFWLFSWDLTSESHLHHWMMVQTERTNCCCCCYVVTKGCDDLWKRYKQKYHGNSSTKRWKNMNKILVSKITHALYKSKRACMYGVCFLLFNSTLSYRYVAIACIFCGLKSFFLLDFCAENDQTGLSSNSHWLFIHATNSLKRFWSGKWIPSLDMQQHKAFSDWSILEGEGKSTEFYSGLGQMHLGSVGLLAAEFLKLKSSCSP